MATTRCNPCGTLKAAVSRAKGDLNHVARLLVQAQGYYPERVDGYVAEVEHYKAVIAEAEERLGEHLDRCTVVRSTTQAAPARHLTQDEIRELRELRDQGWTLQAIADHLGVSRTTVQGHAAKAGDGDPVLAALFAVDDQPWAADGLCAQTDPESFFPEKGGSTREAKAVCRGDDRRPACPVREQCLEYALKNEERFGIWGGLSERERRKLKNHPVTTLIAS